MANNFSDDLSCVALWRFESGSLTADSKGTNTLTAYTTSPTTDTVNFKEGAASAKFNGNSYFYRNDNVLSSTFPFRAADTVKTGTICFWYKADNNVIYAKIFSKWDWLYDKTSFAIQPGCTSYYGGIDWGTSGFTSTFQQFDRKLTNGRWYHFGIIINGATNHTAKVIIYDSVLDAYTVNTYTFPSALWVGNAPLILGSEVNGYNKINGTVDEMVVFDRELDESEVHAIRAGTFTTAPPVVPTLIENHNVDVIYDEGSGIGYHNVDVIYDEGSGIGYHNVNFVYSTIVHRVYPIENVNVKFKSETGRRIIPILH